MRDIVDSGAHVAAGAWVLAALVEGAALTVHHAQLLICEERRVKGKGKGAGC